MIVIDIGDASGKVVRRIEEAAQAVSAALPGI